MRTAIDDSKPTALVLRTAGTNCDVELCRAFERAGAHAELVHLSRLIEDQSALHRADLIGLPGGFSYGDDIAAGRAFSVLVERHLRSAFDDAVDRGVPVVGICNGFQVLVQTGMLPGGGHERCISLEMNANSRFIDRWVGMRVTSAETNVWTRSFQTQDFDQKGFEFPVAHGEGRIVVSRTVDPLALCEGRAVLQYTEDINGSVEQIAGLGDSGGLVFGLMPHPERYLDAMHHPMRSSVSVNNDTPGLAFFRSAVAHVLGITV